jgi:hypothetical protein
MGPSQVQRRMRDADDGARFHGTNSGSGSLAQPKGKRIVGYIFRAWITKDGVRLYAREYGHKAWRIPIYG